MLLWAVDRAENLGPQALSLLRDRENEIVVSAASVWELAVKVGLGKLSLSLPFRSWIHKALADLEASLLPIDVAHADQVIHLPKYHRDPFDRLIIAQAIVEQTPILTADREFAPYPIRVFW
ncbi:MAG: type II toxin-antitoxin system VapC family toxin [Planctomycetes bacterium]|nr:type II toxin-antitoxin system VapC family toxin [Planctomycetota bacterium]